MGQSTTGMLLLGASIEGTIRRAWPHLKAEGHHCCKQEAIGTRAAGQPQQSLQGKLDEAAACGGLNPKGSKLG